jgi:hypothetical protein
MERRAADPILPLHLFKEPIFTRGSLALLLISVLGEWVVNIFIKSVPLKTIDEYYETALAEDNPVVE